MSDYSQEFVRTIETNAARWHQAVTSLTTEQQEFIRALCSEVSRTAVDRGVLLAAELARKCARSEKFANLIDFAHALEASVSESRKSDELEL